MTDLSHSQNDQSSKPPLQRMVQSQLLPYDPIRLLETIKKKLQLKSDSELARLLGVAPQRVSKIRRRVNPVNAAFLIRMAEVSPFGIDQLRAIVGDRRSKYRLSPTHYQPKPDGTMVKFGENGKDGEED